MFKKLILMVFTVALIVTGVGVAQAQLGEDVIDGLMPVEVRTLNLPYINPGGVGDALLYGYYNVRGNLNLFNIVNTDSTDGAKVRVVFRNAKDSRECLDFSVCLSKGDVFTAYLIDNGTTAAICPYDTDTTTAPAIPENCYPFKYDGAGGLKGVTADDCREGYFEVYGLSRIPQYNHNVDPLTVAECRDWGSAYDVTNVLAGNNTIVDLTTLATYSANAVAIANAANMPVVVSSGLEKSIPEVIDSNTDVIGLGMTACQYADYMFMKSNVLSPYDLISSIGGETEVIITFPTRLACHNVSDPNDMFEGDKNPSTPQIDYCTTMAIDVWDDKEHRLDIMDFSPSTGGLCLPYEVNVIRLGGSAIWNSAVARVVGVGTYDLGWVNIDLFAGRPQHETIFTLGNYYTIVARGLPAVAYTTQSFVGGQASYMVPAMYLTNNMIIE